ncbi:MAG: hypothetical protein BJ554DRAFT_1806, partial [Olpidium bornovanus]
VLKAKDGVEGEAELFDEEELEDGSDDDLGDEDEDEVEDEDEDEDEDTPPKDAEKQSRGNSGNKRTADEALNQDLDKHLFAPNVRAAAKKETETEVESEEEELLGDEEMRKFDGKIAEVIRQMKLEKSRKRVAQSDTRKPRRPPSPLRDSRGREQGFQTTLWAGIRPGEEAVQNAPGGRRPCGSVGCAGGGPQARAEGAERGSRQPAERGEPVRVQGPAAGVGAKEGGRSCPHRRGREDRVCVRRVRGRLSRPQGQQAPRGAGVFGAGQPVPARGVGGAGAPPGRPRLGRRDPGFGSRGPRPGRCDARLPPHAGLRRGQAPGFRKKGRRGRPAVRPERRGLADGCREDPRMRAQPHGPRPQRSQGPRGLESRAARAEPEQERVGQGGVRPGVAGVRTPAGRRDSHKRERVQ